MPSLKNVALLGATSRPQTPKQGTAASRAPWSIQSYRHRQTPPHVGVVASGGSVGLSASGLPGLPWCSCGAEPPPEKEGAALCVTCRGYVRRKRGRVLGWSRASRRRFLMKLCRVEWSLMGDLAVMVTLTYPREFTGTPREWKRQLAHFALRWERRWGAEPRGVWKMEWQRPRKKGRMAGQAGPHFHLVLIQPPNVPLPLLEAWVRVTWNSLVAPGDLAALEHGTDVRRADVRTAPVYLGREIGKRAQTVLPPEHIAAGAGRWTGWWNVEEAVGEQEVRHGEFVVLRRVLRRLARSRGYRPRVRSRYQGMTVFSRGPRWRLYFDLTRYLEAIRAGAPPP